MPAPIVEVAVASRKTFRIPSVRRDTVREHVFGMFEPRRLERLQVLDDVSLDVCAGRDARHHGPQRLAARARC